MLSISRTTLTAIVLASSLSVAQAQTASDQDHAAHHPQGQDTAPGQTMPMRQGQVEGMQGMMQFGREPGDGSAMMGTDMSQMMETMRRMMGTMMGAPEPRPPSSADEGSRMGEMMQSMGQMMGTMGRMMEEHGPSGAMKSPSAQIDRRIAALKSALDITDAQMPQWTAFADALRSGSQKAGAIYAQTLHGGTPTSAPERAELRVKLLSAMLDGLKATVSAEKSLYAVLTDDQKRIADTILSGHSGRM